MRRILVVAALVATVLAILAAPAFAQQRDPFEPLVSEEAATGVSPAGSSGIIEGPSVQPVSPTTPETLADTGAGVDTYLALAYGLLVAGGAAVVIARTWSPATPLRRRSA